MILFKKNHIILVLQCVVLTCFTLNVQASAQETVYLQTDRTVYIAGETVFYKLNVLDAATRKRSDISKVGYIELRAPKSDAALKFRVKVDAGSASGGIVLPDSLQSGVYQVIAFTNFMRNLGEKSFFSKELLIVNRFDKKSDFKQVKSNLNDSSACSTINSSHWITTDKPIYGPREKVRVRLGKTNSKANVAISVFEDYSLAEKSIVETLKKPSANNLSMLYSPENRAKILRGRVIDSTTQENVQAAVVFLSCPDSVANLQYATTDSNGLFQLLLTDYYNGKELFLTIRNKPASQTWKIVIEDNFNLSEKWQPDQISNKGLSKTYISKSQDIVYINKSYNLDDGVNELNFSGNYTICPQLYRCPVKTVYPADFVALDNFSEIVVEILPSVTLSKHDGKYTAHVITSLNYTYGDNKPAIFLDGVYVDDISKIMDLGSDRISKIDVLVSERAFGEVILYGIISITSKSKEILRTTPASNSLRVKNDLTNTNKSFITVSPELLQDKNTPIFKQLLYWNPALELNISTGTDFDFFTSDNAAKFIVKVEGISDDGTPISSCTSIQVTDPINVTDK